MTERTPNQIVDALRKCSQTCVCAGCPYQFAPRCNLKLMSDAAALIEAQEVKKA